MRILSISILIAFAIQAFSQEVLTFSEDMIPICNPSDFSGLVINLPVTNDDGFYDSDDCDGTRENVVYLSFVAWTDQMEMQFSPNSCSSNGSDSKRGIQVSVFSIDENGDPEIIADLCECDDQIVDITLMLLDLIPGQQYYIFIDGCAGDVCDVSILLPLPTTMLPPYSLPSNAGINLSDESGEGVYCEGEEFNVELVNFAEASFSYDYTITEIYLDGSTSQQMISSTELIRDTIESNIDSIIYLIDLYNPCDTLRGISDTLVVTRFVKEVFPDASICAGDTLFLLDWMGQPLFQPLFYSDTINLANGCELIQEIDLDNFPIASTIIDTTTCTFPITILGEVFNSPVQNFRIIIEDGDVNGCDSILSLNVMENNFDGEIIPIDCDINSSTLGFLPDGLSPFDSIQLNWTVNAVNFNQDTLVLNAGETADLSVDVFLNGIACTRQLGSFTSNPLLFTGAYQLDCQDGLLGITFLPDDTDFDQIIYNWEVNGTSFLNNGPQIDMPLDGVVSLSVTVSKDGDSCSFNFGPDQYWDTAPNINAILAQSCVDDTLLLSLDFDNNSVDSILYFWSVNAFPFSIDPSIMVSTADQVMLSVITYNDGLDCNYEFSYSYNNEIPCDDSCVPASILLDTDLDTLCWNGIDPISTGLMSIATSNMGVNGTGQWLNSEVNNLSETFSPSIAVDSNYTLVYEYIENGDCFARDSLSITVNIIPDPIISLSTNVLCIGDTLIITTDFGLNGVNNSNWFLEEAVILSGDFNQSGEILSTYPVAGSFQLFTTLFNESCSATISDTLLITVHEGAKDFNVSCIQDFDQITFFWDGQDCIDFYAINIEGLFVENTTDTFYILDQLLPDQQVSFLVEAFEGCFCGNSATAQIDCNTSACPLAQIDFNVNQVDLCVGDDLPIQLTAQSGLDPNVYSGTWTGTNIDQSGLFSPAGMNVGSLFIYHEITGNNCTYLDSVQVSIHDLPEFTFTFIVDSCGNSDMIILDYDILSANGNTQMLLDGSALASSSQTVSLEDGIHVLELIDQNQCSSIQSFVINSLITSNAMILGPEEILAGDSIIYNFNLEAFLSQNIEEISWLIDNTVVCSGLNCNHILLSQFEDFELCIEVIYNGNCSATACRDIGVYTELNVYLPTAFSPLTSPGINDEWTLFTNQEGLSVTSLQVYDRWGNLVHFMEDQMIENRKILLWNGRFGDSSINPGVFVYLLELNQEGESIIRKGQITLVR